MNFVSLASKFSLEVDDKMAGIHTFEQGALPSEIAPWKGPPLSLLRFHFLHVSFLVGTFPSRPSYMWHFILRWKLKEY